MIMKNKQFDIPSMSSLCDRFTLYFFYIPLLNIINNNNNQKKNEANPIGCDPMCDTFML